MNENSFTKQMHQGFCRKEYADTQQKTFMTPLFVKKLKNFCSIIFKMAGALKVNYQYIFSANKAGFPWLTMQM